MTQFNIQFLQHTFLFHSLFITLSFFSAEPKQSHTLTLVNNTTDSIHFYWERHNAQNPSQYHSSGIPEIKSKETIPCGLPIPSSDDIRYFYFVKIPSAVPPIIRFTLGNQIQSGDVLEIQESDKVYDVIKKLGDNQSLLATLQKQQCPIEIPDSIAIGNILTEKIKVKYVILTTTGKKHKTITLHIPPQTKAETDDIHNKQLLIPCVAQKIILSQPRINDHSLMIQHSADKTYVTIQKGCDCNVLAFIVCKNTLFNIDTDSIELMSS